MPIDRVKYGRFAVDSAYEKTIGLIWCGQKSNVTELIFTPSTKHTNFQSSNIFRRLVNNVNVVIVLIRYQDLGITAETLYQPPSSKVSLAGD